MDSKDARIIIATPSQIIRSINLTSDEPQIPQDGVNPEYIKNKKKARQTYYDKIVPNIEESKEIVLFGPDNTKEEFLDYLSTHVEHLFSKVIGVESSQDLPEEKIIARGRKYI